MANPNVLWSPESLYFVVKPVASLDIECFFASLELDRPTFPANSNCIVSRSGRRRLLVVTEEPISNNKSCGCD